MRATDTGGNARTANTLPDRVVVTTAWQATYHAPIRVCAGDAVRMTDRTELWDGHTWVWAAANGREGWVPDDLIDPGAPNPVARRDYSAQELTCAAGEILSVTEQSHGWSWCESDAGRAGWVPSRHLAPLEPGAKP